MTMVRVTTEVYEVVAPGTTTASYPTLDEARANRGNGQVRTRSVHTDVPAEYAVRLDGVEMARFPAAAAAAACAGEHKGSTVHMVAQGS